MHSPVAGNAIVMIIKEYARNKIAKYLQRTEFNSEHRVKSTFQQRKRQYQCDVIVFACTMDITSAENARIASRKHTQTYNKFEFEHRLFAEFTIEYCYLKMGIFVFLPIVRQHTITLI